MQIPKSVEKEKEAYKIIRDIIKILSIRSDDFPTFLLKKKLKGCTGWTDYESISLSVFSELVPTIIHEMIHFMHFSWSETKVIKAEHLVRHYIKMKDVVKILKLFVENL